MKYRSGYLIEERFLCIHGVQRANWALGAMISMGKWYLDIDVSFLWWSFSIELGEAR